MNTASSFWQVEVSVCVNVAMAYTDPTLKADTEGPHT